MEKSTIEFNFYVQFFEHKLICYSKMTNQDIANCIILILNGIRKQYGEGKLKLLNEKEEQITIDQIIENKIGYVFVELPGRIDIETDRKIEQKKIRSIYTANENSTLTIEKIKQTKQDNGKLQVVSLAKAEMKQNEINQLNLNFSKEFDQLKNNFMNIYSAAAPKSTTKKDKIYYTIADVAKHNQPDDAWMIINREIYDITEYAKIHPGGKQILIKRAGQDGTEFLIKFHPYVNATKLLEKYYIGDLKK